MFARRLRGCAVRYINVKIEDKHFSNLKLVMGGQMLKHLQVSLYHTCQPDGIFLPLDKSKYLAAYWPTNICKQPFGLLKIFGSPVVF